MITTECSPGKYAVREYSLVIQILRVISGVRDPSNPSNSVAVGLNVITNGSIPARLIMRKELKNRSIFSFLFWVSAMSKPALSPRIAHSRRTHLIG